MHVELEVTLEPHKVAPHPRKSHPVWRGRGLASEWLLLKKMPLAAQQIWSLYDIIARVCCALDGTCPAVAMVLEPLRHKVDWETMVGVLGWG